VKVFYIQNASTQNELMDIFNGVRTGAKLTTGIFSVPSQNAIVVRGSSDTVSLAEKLVHDLDRPKAEVLIDVMVMEVNKTVMNTIGAALLGQGGLSLPVNFTPRSSIAVNGSSSSTTTTTGTGTPGTIGTGTTGTGTTGTGTTSTTNTTGGAVGINNLRHLSSADFSTTLPSTLIQALTNDARNHVMQRPQLRASDGGKASLKIGAKIPYVSGSLNSAVATPGAIPYATTQFQQVDVGTNIDLQPHVNGTDEISMHIKVEISNVLQEINIAGIQEPEIGQQVDEADIRMKDGEVSILGGLSDKELQNTLSGFPGLTNLPILGSLFGTRIKTSTDNQVLIALIPHIIRAPDMTHVGEAGVYAGSERVTRVEHRQDGGGATATMGGSASNMGTSPVPAAATPAVANPNLVPAQTPLMVPAGPVRRQQDTQPAMPLAQPAPVKPPGTTVPPPPPSGSGAPPAAPNVP
jgi:general secretion pathway protein D